MKIRVDALDKLFSRCVRLMSGGYCKRCKKYVGYNKLHNAHFHSRRKYSVRWDFDNTAPLCYGCHSFIDGNPFVKIEFFMELLGSERFAELNTRAEQIGKYDKEKIKAELKTKIRILEQD